MPSFDPNIQFLINLAIAIFGITVGAAVTIYVFHQQRQHPDLTWEILSNSPLISVSDQIKPKIQIRYENMPVSDIGLVLVRINNDGNIPIVETDFAEPLSLILPENTIILSKEISDPGPTGSKAEFKELKNPSDEPLSNEKPLVKLKPPLLNPGDSLTIKLLVNKSGIKLNWDGHIKGIKEVRLKDNNLTRSNRSILWNILLSFSALVIAILIGFVRFSVALLNVVVLVIVFFFTAAAFYFFYSAIRELAKRKS